MGGKTVKTGKGKNFLQPNSKATGDHSTFRTNVDGKVSHYETWTKNPQNPKGFDSVKRVDTQYSNSHSYVNKVTGESVSTPHVQSKNIPGRVRSAILGELPQ